MESGPCSGSFNRWYFNKEIDQCEPFVYGGCKGNKNNYGTEAACTHHCKKPGIGKGRFRLIKIILVFSYSIVLNCNKIYSKLL